MILGFVIFGIFLAVIAIFSMATAIQHHDSPIGSAIVLAIALVLTGVSIWKLPYWSNNHQSSSAESSSKSASLASSHPFTSSSSTTSQSQNEETVRKQLNKSLHKLGPVTFNPKTKTYVLTITNSDLVKTIKALEKDPSQAKQAKWPKFVSNFTQTSQSLEKALGKGYSLTLGLKGQSPVLVFKDGYVTKNEFE
ncbi:DUF1206 domain-containing protein [Levilactobacillus tongjiangensis]|uniref:DUF1206 domain-containing protein n=1 Tax=Levilactobacillus tongjiangensis TaxID=2486023 RepID=A0ABW1SQ76_9LACO|nr:DUF1206 domain-containing protein [Levilactobacillus tongjiangensis]